MTKCWLTLVCFWRQLVQRIIFMLELKLRNICTPDNRFDSSSSDISRETRIHYQFFSCYHYPQLLSLHPLLYSTYCSKYTLHVRTLNITTLLSIIIIIYLNVNYLHRISKDFSSSNKGVHKARYDQNAEDATFLRNETQKKKGELDLIASAYDS